MAQISSQKNTAQATSPGQPPSHPSAAAVKVQNIGKDKLIDMPEKNIRVVGTISGRLIAHTVEAWRAQKTMIQANKTICIRKEIIGSEPGEIPGEEVVEGLKFDDPKLGNATIISAPVIVVGQTDEHASVSKIINFQTERLVMSSVTVLDHLDIHLGKPFFKALRKIERQPKKIGNVIKRLSHSIEMDMDDIEAKAARHGNEEVRPLVEKLKSLISTTPENHTAILACLKKVLEGLRVRKFGEILERWSERFTAEKSLKEVLVRLDKIYARLNKMTVDLKIDDLKAGGKIVILFGNDSYTIDGPQKNTTFAIRHHLTDDPESGFKRGELQISAQ